MPQTILAVDGVRAPLLQAGPPQATEAVVFVHGNPGSSQDWARLVARTGAVAWDHPGFGHADKPAGFDHTVNGDAVHLGRCLDALGITRTHLVLHDVGGPWGLAWPATHPALAPRCSTSGSCPATAGTTLPGPAHPTAGGAGQRHHHRAGFGLLLRHGNPRAGCPERWLTAWTPTWTGGSKRASWPGTGPPPPQPATASGWGGAAAAGVSDPGALGPPRPYLPVALAARQREAFPSAPIEVLDGSGHWPFIDDPERTERLVLEFLGEAVSSRPPRRGRLTTRERPESHVKLQ
jgi:pimeloyl-ACP methyl ester carboxylesterase